VQFTLIPIAYTLNFVNTWIIGAIIIGSDNLIKYNLITSLWTFVIMLLPILEAVSCTKPWPFRLVDFGGHALFDSSLVVAEAITLASALWRASATQ